MTGIGWLVVLPLMALPWAVRAQQGSTVECPPYDEASSPVPDYPVEELWRLQRYAVTVIVQPDAYAATLEKRSGIPVLDDAALASARARITAPQYRSDQYYRQPFDFEPVPERIDRLGNVRLRDPFFSERSTARVPVPSNVQGDSLPGYIDDPYPIGYLTGRELIATLAPIALFRNYGAWGFFWLHDEEGLSLFEVSRDLIVRNRLVNDGVRQFVVSSALWPMELEPCRQQLAQLRARRDRQMAQPLAVDAP